MCGANANESLQSAPEDASKSAARAKRFGLESSGKQTPIGVDPDVLAKRAARFGLPVDASAPPVAAAKPKSGNAPKPAPAAAVIDDPEKLAKRAARFGSSS